MRSTEQSAFRGREKCAKVPRKGEKEGWPAEGAKRKRGCVKTGQKTLPPPQNLLLGPAFFKDTPSLRSVVDFGRERKLNTNFFFSNLSGTSGISRQNPGISRQKSLVSLISRDIPNFSAPTPSRGRPPPHQKISGLKSLGLGSFFVLEIFDNVRRLQLFLDIPPIPAMPASHDLRAVPLTKPELQGPSYATSQTAVPAPSVGNENSAQSSSDRSFSERSLGVVDVRTRSRVVDVRAQMLVFPEFRGP